MVIETKFNHGDRVHAIVHGTQEIEKQCYVCNGTGRVFVANFGETNCPSCYGIGSKKHRETTKWYVPTDAYFHFIIRKIVHESHQKKSERTWTYYMSDTSGTMFDEKDLFLSEEDAQKECDKRNSL